MCLDGWNFVNQPTNLPTKATTYSVKSILSHFVIHFSHVQTMDYRRVQFAFHVLQLERPTIMTTTSPVGLLIITQCKLWHHVSRFPIKLSAASFFRCENEEQSMSVCYTSIYLPLLAWVIWWKWIALCFTRTNHILPFPDFLPTGPSQIPAMDDGSHWRNCQTCSSPWFHQNVFSASSRCCVFSSMTT